MRFQINSPILTFRLSFFDRRWFLCAQGIFLPIMLFFILGWSNITLAQDKTAEVDKIFSWATPSTPGCACEISQHGKVVMTRSYGLANLAQNLPIGMETAFDIGSTRKQFIAATILSLVQDKKLSLSDDIRKYLPPFPAYGHKITINHLLTHTSGIRDWTGLLPMASGDPTALSLILQQSRLNFAPGEQWSYSNSGYVLLTEIATHVTKMPFDQLVRQRVFEPLGMKNTYYLSDMQQTIPNRALGYAKDGNQWKTNMYLGNDRGGGAIFSTAGDLTIWNNALAKSSLGTFITQKLMEPTILNNGRKLNYARGLILDPYRDTQLVWHSGGAAGYHTWIGRIPSQDLSIVVLCNSDARTSTSLAHRLLALYYPTTTPVPAEDGPPPTLVGEQLSTTQAFTGLFFNEETAEPLTLSLDLDRFRVAGGPGLVPIGNKRYRRWGTGVYFMSQDQFELNFLTADQFELKSMEGKITRYRRAKPHQPTNTELAEFVGRYQSKEVNATIGVSPKTETLVLRLNDQPNQEFECKLVDPDTFQFRGVIVRFVRNQAGKVIALDYSNPVVSHILFTK